MSRHSDEAWKQEARRRKEERRCVRDLRGERRVGLDSRNDGFPDPQESNILIDCENRRGTRKRTQCDRDNDDQFEIGEISGSKDGRRNACRTAFDELHDGGRIRLSDPLSNYDYEGVDARSPSGRPHKKKRIHEDRHGDDLNRYRSNQYEEQQADNFDEEQKSDDEETSTQRSRSEYHSPKRCDRSKEGSNKRRNKVVQRESRPSSRSRRMPPTERSLTSVSERVEPCRNPNDEMKQEVVRHESISSDFNHRYREPELQFSVCRKVPKDGTKLYVCGDCPEMGGSIDPCQVQNRGLHLDPSESQDHYETPEFTIIKSRAPKQLLQYIYYLYHPKRGVIDVENVLKPRMIRVPEPQPPYSDDEVRFSICDGRYNQVDKPAEILLGKIVHGSFLEIEI